VTLSRSSPDSVASMNEHTEAPAQLQSNDTSIPTVIDSSCHDLHSQHHNEFDSLGLKKLVPNKRFNIALEAMRLDKSMFLK